MQNHSYSEFKHRQEPWRVELGVVRNFFFKESILGSIFRLDSRKGTTSPVYPCCFNCRFKNVQYHENEARRGGSYGQNISDKSATASQSVIAGKCYDWMPGKNTPTNVWHCLVFGEIKGQFTSQGPWTQSSRREARPRCFCLLFAYLHISRKTHGSLVIY